MLRRVALLALVALVGCGSDAGLELRHWRLGGDAAHDADVTLPDRLDGVARRAGTYTLTTHVELPERWRGPPLTLWVADLPAVATLEVDGVEALATDPPTPGAYRTRGPLGWRIPGEASEDGALELVITVEHRWTQSAWWNAAPVLVAGDERPAGAERVLVCNLYLALAAVISLVQIALTSLLVYLADRKRRAYLWFGLQTAVAAYYPLWILGVTQRVFDIYDTPVLAASLVVALTVSIRFTHEFFELAPPWRGWLVIGGLALAVIAWFHGPFDATRISGPVTIAVVGAITLYQLFICARLAITHRDRHTARNLLAAWLVLGAMLPADLFYWLGRDDLLGGARPTSAGLLGYGLCLSFLLGRRHLLHLRAETQLNVELRRQVAERSTQLFAALSLAGDSRARAPLLRAGEVVNERYRVVKELGRGGMGTVYEVVRIADGRHLALKLTHDVTGNALARLAREALIASRIDHRNLVAVLDVDVAASSFLYVVMELVEGESLKALKARHGDAAWALPLLAQIADGLGALHAAGVVHRDLKPANVLLTTAGEVKITDFGVSRRLEEEEDTAVERADAAPADLVHELDTVTIGGDTKETQPVGLTPRRPSTRTRSSDVTRTGMLVGTPPYIAPELVDGPQALSPAADLYAFGVLAWELIAGEKPLALPAALARLQGLAAVAPPSLATRWPGGAAAVVALIDRCLDADRAARPNAQEASAQLARYRGGDVRPDRL